MIFTQTIDAAVTDSFMFVTWNLYLSCSLFEALVLIDILLLEAVMLCFHVLERVVTTDMGSVTFH
jgi:hypothetical protein